MAGMTNLALVQLMLLLLFLLPALVLVGIDYLIYQSLDRRILMLAAALGLLLIGCCWLEHYLMRG
jgi:hypothetical protein